MYRPLVAVDLTQNVSIERCRKRMEIYPYSFLMFTERGVDDTHVEKDLGRVRDVVELLQRLLKFVVVIAAQGRYPRLYFLNS